MDDKERLEDLLFDLLGSHRENQISTTEKILMFLVMEPFIIKLRNSGFTNRDILDFAMKIDEKRNG